MITFTTAKNESPMMKKQRIFWVTAMLCAASGPVLASGDWQSLLQQDPTLRSMYQQAESLWPQASSNELMVWPSNGFQWPCEVQEVQVRKMVGVMAIQPDELTADERRTMPTVPDSDNPEKPIMRISGVKVAPISGECQNGKLHGMVDFLIDYTRLDKLHAHSPDVIAGYRARVKVEMDQGKVALKKIRAVVSKEVRNEVKSANGQVESLPLSTSLALDTQIADAEQYAVIFNLMTGVELVRLLTMPVAPETTETRVFMGNRLASKYRMKNNLHYGNQESFDAQGNVKAVYCFDKGGPGRKPSC